MIGKDSFSIEWLKELKKKLHFRNSAVAEKMIHAIALLELLASLDFNFVLKGGTSLIFLTNELRRFSVDVDILTQASIDELHDILSQVCETERFYRFEYDKRRSNNSDIPKAHFKIFYKSIITDREDRLLLDVLFEKSHYSSLISRKIESKIAKCVEPYLSVLVPSIESILGDKLTAFAPHTTGILFERGKELEMAKQLYDIGVLYDLTKQISEVSASFNEIVKIEMGYRKLTYDIDLVLKDIINTALLIASKGSGLSRKEKNEFEELVRGIRSLNEYLINDRFTLEGAIVASAKAALIASKIMKDDNSEIKRYNEQPIQDYLINNERYNKLNKLKRTPGGGLFYWNNIIQLIGRK